MQLHGKALRVTIYVGESDRYHGQPLPMALLEFLKRGGASGATLMRGVAGFGAHSRIHTATIVTLSADLPIRIEWIDPPETVQRLLPTVRQMVDDGLIVQEEVDVVQYAPGRRPNPLEQPVHDIMRTNVTTVTPDTPLDRVVALLLERGHRSLPVVEADGVLCGILTDGDLLRRGGLLARLNAQVALSAAQVQQQLDDLRRQPRTARDVMSQSVLTVQADDPVSLAVSRMVERGLKRLPVVDADQCLLGLVSRVDVLRALEYHQPVGQLAASPPRTGHSVAELMYRDAPAVGADARLEEIVQALESSRQRRAVVIDKERRVLGIISDGDLLQRSRHARHPNLLTRLRSLITGQGPHSLDLPDAGETAADLMTTPAMTITLQTPLADALRLMVQHHIKRLPVVDEEGRLVGLLGRGSLLRGILGGAEAGDSPA